MKRKPALVVTILAIVAAPLLFFNSCKKSQDIAPDTTATQTVTAGITGRVLDENRLPVTGAAVAAGTVNVKTDLDGNFTLQNVALSKNAGNVTITKTGYFLGSRTFNVSANTTNYVEVQLIPKTTAGSFTASNGGNITVPTGGSISFQANSIITDSSKSTYSGAVKVAAAFINPSDPHFSSIVPGNMKGTTTGNQQKGLQSFGIMAVELTGANGEKLQLAGGKTAAVNFPAPASQPNASSVSLWSFDETTGLWKQEGTITKNGNNYVGTVSHFSFWDYTVPYTLVNFQAIVKDQSNTPLAGFKVVLTAASDSTISGFGYSDSLGNVTGQIPASQALTMQVYDRSNTLVQTKSIGPFSADVNFGTISLTIASSRNITFSGTVIDCGGNAVTNGYVDIVVNSNSQRASITSGAFSITIALNVTAVNASFTATNLATGQQGAAVSLVLSLDTISGNTIPAGQLNACADPLNQYINYTINGTSYSLSSSTGDTLSQALVSNRNDIYGVKVNNASTPFYIGFVNGGVVPGPATVSGINVPAGNKTYVYGGTINLNETAYGSINQFITGNFSGNVADTSAAGGGAKFPVTGSFRVKRSQ